MMIFNTLQRNNAVVNMNSFYNSEVYKLLKSGVEHHFELEFNVDGKTGHENEDKNNRYQGQLDFYKDVVETLGYKVFEAKLLWLK
jgi:hypothetical protein